jgi:thioredoxin
MNNAMRIGIVVVLVVAVGIVLAVKVGRSEKSAATPCCAIPAPTSAPSLPRLVDLGADKCIPCKMMAPVLEELRDEYADQLSVEFYDVWKNPDYGEQYNVRVIPTQIFYDADGDELWRHQGFLSKEAILAKWKEFGLDLAGADGAPPLTAQ